MSPILQGLANGSVRGYGGYLPLGPSGAFESIASTTTTAGQVSVTFSSIPSTYQSLQIRYNIQSNRAATNDEMFMRINGSSSAIYGVHRLSGDGTSVYATGAYGYTQFDPLAPCSASLATDVFASGILDIHDYASTTKTKVVRNFSGYDRNGAGEVALMSGLFNSTSAITSLTFDINISNFSANSTIALYGIKG
jgi:hypothetical protein